MIIRILDEAQSDLHESAQFYEQQSNGLVGDTVNIYAVLDCRRNPDRTIEQLKKRRV